MEAPRNFFVSSSRVYEIAGPRRIVEHERQLRQRDFGLGWSELTAKIFFNVRSSWEKWYRRNCATNFGGVLNTEMEKLFSSLMKHCCFASYLAKVVRIKATMHKISFP